MGQRNVLIDWDLPTFEEMILATTPTLSAIYEAANQEEAYYLALKIVDLIDPLGVTYGLPAHWRNRGTVDYLG